MFQEIEKAREVASGIVSQAGDVFQNDEPGKKSLNEPLKFLQQKSALFAFAPVRADLAPILARAAADENQMGILAANVENVAQGFRVEVGNVTSHEARRAIVELVCLLAVGSDIHAAEDVDSGHVNLFVRL